VAAQQQAVRAIAASVNTALQRDDQPTVERLTHQADDARRVLRDLLQRERGLVASVDTARAQEHKADIDLQRVEATIKVGQMKSAELDAARYENWIHDLWNAAPLTDVTERPHAGVGTDDVLHYAGTAEGNGGVGERFIAVTDLLGAEPPHRPKMSR